MINYHHAALTNTGRGNAACKVATYYQTPHQSMQLHQEGKSKIAIYFAAPPNPAHNSSITAANIQAEQYFSHHAVGLDKITAAPILS